MPLLVLIWWIKVSTFLFYRWVCLINNVDLNRSTSPVLTLILYTMDWDAFNTLETTGKVSCPITLCVPICKDSPTWYIAICRSISTIIVFVYVTLLSIIHRELSCSRRGISENWVIQLHNSVYHITLCQVVLEVFFWLAETLNYYRSSHHIIPIPNGINCIFSWRYSNLLIVTISINPGNWTYQ